MLVVFVSAFSVLLLIVLVMYRLGYVLAAVGTTFVVSKQLQELRSKWPMSQLLNGQLRDRSLSPVLMKVLCLGRSRSF